MADFDSVADRETLRGEQADAVSGDVAVAPSHSISTFVSFQRADAVQGERRLQTPHVEVLHRVDCAVGVPLVRRLLRRLRHLDEKQCNILDPPHVRPVLVRNVHDSQCRHGGQPEAHPYRPKPNVHFPAVDHRFDCIVHHVDHYLQFVLHLGRQHAVRLQLLDRIADTVARDHFDNRVRAASGLCDNGIQNVRHQVPAGRIDSQRMESGVQQTAEENAATEQQCE